MSNVKPINVGSKWVDKKGRVWEVMRMLANGRYYLTTDGQRQTAEQNVFEIRQMTQKEK